MRPLPELPGVQHRFVELPGLRMHIAEAGQGEPLLLLHGFPQHWWAWREFIGVFAQRYRVICPDLRGAGWTDAPRDGYKPDQLVADLVALLDELGLQSARIVAHDWGALVAFLLCLDHPECVKQYVSLAIPHPFVRFHLQLLAALPRLWFQPAIATPVPFREPARAKAGSGLYRDFITPVFRHVLARRYRSKRLHTPTLILYGSEDANMRPEILGDTRGWGTISCSSKSTVGRISSPARSPRSSSTG